MKITVLLACLALLFAPLVLADGGGDAHTGVQATATANLPPLRVHTMNDNRTSNDSGNGSRQQLIERYQQERQNLQQQFRSKLMEASKLNFERRQVLSQARQQYLQSMQQTRTEYEQELSSFHDDQNAFLQLKTHLQKCEQQNGTNSSSCTDLRANVTIKARQSLTHAIDALIKNMQTLQARANASTSLNDSQVSAIVNMTNSIITRAQALKTNVSSAQNGQDIAADAKQLAALLKEARGRSDLARARIDGEELWTGLKQAERLDAQFNCSTNATVNGSAFVGHVATAQQALLDARNAYNENDTEGARGNFSLARTELEDARQTAIQTLSQLRQEHRGLSDCRVAVRNDDFSNSNLGHEIELPENETEHSEHSGADLNSSEHEHSSEHTNTTENSSETMHNETNSTDNSPDMNTTNSTGNSTDMNTTNSTGGDQ